MIPSIAATEPTRWAICCPQVDLGTGRSAVKLSAGLEHSCALLDDSKIKCWGDNLFGELGLGDTVGRGDGVNEMGDLLPTVDL